MEETKSLICTRCGSHHLEKQSETEYKCLSCDAIITKEKAVNFEKEYRKLLEEGKSVDIANLRYLARKALEGHIDKDSLIKYSQDILRILPEDILSLFYIKYINREKNPFEYESFLKRINSEATQTEVDEIIDIIITNARFREKDEIINIINKFYKGREDKLTELEKALKQRTKEIDLFSDIPRDVFICHSSLDKDKVNEILKMLEEDGNTCWISSRNIPWDSDNYWDNITKAIKSCNIFLCLNSINTMQSNDCRREVEIASSLNKKRIEYKLDEARDITLFKNFFTGQWITNINDLLIKVYDLKHKEETLYKEGISLFKNKKYQEAILIFSSIESYEDAKEYLIASKELIKVENLIQNGMYEEAKTVLLSISNLDCINEYIVIINNKLKIDKEKKEATEKVKPTYNFKDVNKTYEDASMKKTINGSYDKQKNISNGQVNHNKDAIIIGNNNSVIITDNNRVVSNKVNIAINNHKTINQTINDNVNQNKIITNQNKEIIWFGKYPQKLKSDKVTIANINEYNDLYEGNDGYLYVKKVGNPYHMLENISGKNQLNSVFSNGKPIEAKDYYFKIGLISWRILSRNNGKLLLVSNFALDVKKFDEKSNNYENSSIRKWLNTDFYNYAFSSDEKLIMQNNQISTKVCDKVFLLSTKDLKNNEYGFDNFSEKSFSRQVDGTDYARCMHLNAGSTFCNYLARTPQSISSKLVNIVNECGEIVTSSVDCESNGVVVSIIIDENEYRKYITKRDMQEKYIIDVRLKKQKELEEAKKQKELEEARKQKELEEKRKQKELEEKRKQKELEEKKYDDSRKQAEIDILTKPIAKFFSKDGYQLAYFGFYPDTIETDKKVPIEWYIQGIGTIMVKRKNVTAMSLICNRKTKEMFKNPESDVKKLNKKFFQKAFTKEQKALIKAINVFNSKDPFTGTRDSGIIVQIEYCDN